MGIYVCMHILYITVFAQVLIKYSLPSIFLHDLLASHDLSWKSRDTSGYITECVCVCVCVFIAWETTKHARQF